MRKQDFRLMSKPPRQSSNQPLGDLWIEMVSSNKFGTSAYERELDIDSAEAKVQYTYRGAHYTRRAICSPERQILAIQLSADEPISCNVYASSPQASSNSKIDGDAMILSGRNGPVNGVSGAPARSSLWPGSSFGQQKGRCKPMPTESRSAGPVKSP